MPIRRSDLSGRQLSGGRADQQRTLVCWVINSHHINDRLVSTRKVQVAPPPEAHLTLFNLKREIFVGATFGPLRPWMQHRPVPPRSATLPTPSLSGCATQSDIAAQAANECIVRSGRGELVAGGDPRIDTKQALFAAFGQVSEHFGDGFFATCTKAGPAHHADACTVDEGDTGADGHNIGFDGAPSPVAVAFPQQCTSTASPQARNRRGVDGMNCSPFAPQPHSFDWQLLNTPRERVIEEQIQTELAALDAALDAVPTPTQMCHVGKSGACEATLMLDELAGEHRHEHDPNKVSGAGRQTADQIVDSTSSQVNWRGSQVERWFVWLRHPSSIAKPGCFWLLTW